MPLNTQAMLDVVVSHAMSSGLFERVNQHEAVSAPGNGLSFEVWLQSIGPVIGGSGLSSTSGRVEFTVRLLTNEMQEPRNLIDPNMAAAVDALLTAYSGDFELGGNVRCVDLLGQSGQALSAKAGFLSLDDKLYRVMDIVLPLIVNDLWDQQP